MKRNREPKAKDKENQGPNSKKKCMSLKGKERFTSIPEDRLAELSKGYVPPNTTKNTDWSMRVFIEWQNYRDRMGKSIESGFKEPYDCAAISHCLSAFVSETRKANGEQNPPKSLYQILCGVLRSVRSRDPFFLNFLHQKDPRFRKLHGTCECLFRDLRQQGIGANPKKTPSISKEENMLWDTGVLGCKTPEALNRSVFFYSGKCFCLRGSEKQRRLKPSQLIHKGNPDQYVYIETGSKNHSGGLRELNIENKVVPVYSSPAAGEHCLVHLLDLYLSKLPPVAFEKDVFYWRPKTNVPDSSMEPWYSCQPVGKHKLDSMVATMCAKAGITERKTNHSLRVTGATAMYSGGVPEREIQQRTGHRSLEALGKYKRTSEGQHPAVSNVLLSQVDLPYSHHLSSNSHSQFTHTCSYTQPSNGINLQSLFNAGSGTLNISPQGNFTVNIHMEKKSAWDAANEGDEFNALVRDVNFDLN